MIEENQIRELERILKDRKYELQSHGFGHLHRTAEGTRIFISTDEEEIRNRAYTVGLLHEERLDKIQETLKPLKLSSGEISTVIFSVEASHRKSYENKNRIIRAVSFSNDILEGDGSFGVARTCFFCGEANRYAGKRAEEAIVDRLEYHRKDSKRFPSYVAVLLGYQNEWYNQFLIAMKNKESWAMDMGDRLFLDGRAKHILEDSIRKIDTKYVEQQRFVKEAVDYMERKKDEDFQIQVLSELV